MSLKPGKWRNRIAQAHLQDEIVAIQSLLKTISLDQDKRKRIEQQAASLVEAIRRDKQGGLMETFLAEYGLSTEEGIALMCLAEALLRVPDAPTIDALIQDKIVAADWGRHLGHSASPLVNASTWALMLTGKVISPDQSPSLDILGSLRGMIKRAGEPVVRNAVKQAMRVLGQQFVLGQTIEQALQRGEVDRQQGYTHSYDMLGEAALTAEDARQYFMAYSAAITALSPHCTQADFRDNPGISVKLSALHPRYEWSQHDRVLDELSTRVTSLAELAKNANMGFNIDAEEADRLELSLDVIEHVIVNPDLRDWQGFGVVVQAYSPRASSVIDYLYQLAKKLDRRIMVRLVKGAYWDHEIKKAQQQGLPAYPVWTRKTSTDVNYLACAQQLLDYSSHLYPQFATHNAHSVMAVLQMAGERRDFEFQRLHGMGESLYAQIKQRHKLRCRIYAPVGVHRDLLAYLVRRLLENGANSSFVNQLMDVSVSPQQLVADPITRLQSPDFAWRNPKIPLPKGLYGSQRQNAAGWDLSHPVTLNNLLKQRDAFKLTGWSACNGEQTSRENRRIIINPGNFSDTVGELDEITTAQLQPVLQRARSAQLRWSQTPVMLRSECLLKLADSLQQHAEELMMLMAREAGKTLQDSISELREAVDFCRYYAAEAQRIAHQGELAPRGLFVCISPWNFPLAIFTGQIVAALVSGNVVIAKPAEQTPLTAKRCIELMHASGIDVDVLQLVPGEGAKIGAALVAQPAVDGVCFTGSTETAQAINRAMAEQGNPQAVLIAETGGINAMIVDSSALLQQAVKDILSSAFQSAGQRCSALRILFVQRDIADDLIALLKGAMDELKIGDPQDPATDIGPLIDADAQSRVQQHCDKLEQQGYLLHRCNMPESLSAQGFFVAPSVFELEHFDQLEQEIFGPVLHLLRFDASQIDQVIDSINARGYGLTLGIHSRVDARVQRMSAHARVGNIYVNRNQIGAVVGSQPFGGEGLSGTGPKAGGPNYLYRFMHRPATDCAHRQGGMMSQGASTQFAAQMKIAAGAQAGWDRNPQRTEIMRLALTHCEVSVRQGYQDLLDTLDGLNRQVMNLPGPTGESNRLSIHGRGVMLCLGAIGDEQRLYQQILLALSLGNAVVVLESDQRLTHFCQRLYDAGIAQEILRLVDHVSLQDLTLCPQLDGVILEHLDASVSDYRDIRRALAARKNAIIPLIDDLQNWQLLIVERSLCIDTTAAGGNTDLLASVS